MATVAERILAAVEVGAADDGELAARLDVSHQTVNQVARRLETHGRLCRSVGAAGKIVNYLPEHPAPTRLHRPRQARCSAKTR